MRGSICPRLINTGAENTTSSKELAIYEERGERDEKSYPGASSQCVLSLLFLSSRFVKNNEIVYP